MTESSRLYDRARELIPGGTMLLSKRPDTKAPDCWPAYYRRAWGSRVEDADGNVLTDFTGDIGATLLGRADPDVNAAVRRVVDAGNFCMLNCPAEVELAELLVEIIPCAEQVRFARGGGEADAIAIRIARGYTGRDRVALCGYHGWHDWYLAANLADDRTLDGHILPGLRPLGVPRGLVGTAVPFEYNNLDSLKRLLESHPGEFAAVIMEPTRHHPPAEGFLEGVRDLSARHGAVLIFDEVVTGFRMALGGAQEYFGIRPDLAVFAKTISNGYPMGAVVGRREVMETVERQFISSTYWTDAIGTVAAVATLSKMRRIDAAATVWKLGGELFAGLASALERSGVPGDVHGWPPHPILALRHEDEQTARAMTTFFVRRQLARGFLSAASHYVMTSHTRRDVQDYLAATLDTLTELKAALDRDTLLAEIDSRPAQPLFRRLA